MDGSFGTQQCTMIYDLVKRKQVQSGQKSYSSSLCPHCKHGAVVGQNRTKSAFGG